MARTSEETLSTRRDRLFSLARYISPSNSSRTGQKSFSKASRLENICISPGPQDAMQLSNERLTTADSRRTGCLIDARESELPRSGSTSERICGHPIRYRPADHRPGVFLDEMRARHGDFGLVFPASAKFSRRADQNGAGFGIDEQLWNLVLRHPLRIVRGYLHDIRWFASYRNLPRPGQRRPAVFALEIRPAIFRHLSLAQLP